MHFFAAAAGKNTIERLRDVPSEFWIRIGLAILILIVAVVVLRKLAKMNKVVLGVAVVLVITIVGFNWVYERNEPQWATPVVQWLANFFPTKAGAAPR
jgi:hypothetical protein